MPPALTPALALDLVHELSADVRAGVILAPSGALLAGPPALADAARALLAAAGDAAEAESVHEHGVVCFARSDAHAALAVCGRFAIPGVVRADLRAALAGLAGRPVPAPPRAAAATPPADPLEAAAAALISAVQRGFQA